MRQEIVRRESAIRIVKAVHAVIRARNLFEAGTGTVVSLGSSRETTTAKAVATALVRLVLRLLLLEYFFCLGGAPGSRHEQLIDRKSCRVGSGVTFVCGRR